MTLKPLTPKGAKMTQKPLKTSKMTQIYLRVPPIRDLFLYKILGFGQDKTHVFPLFI